MHKVGRGSSTMIVGTVVAALALGSVALVTRVPSSEATSKPLTVKRVHQFAEKMAGPKLAKDTEPFALTKSVHAGNCWLLSVRLAQCRMDYRGIMLDSGKRVWCAPLVTIKPRGGKLTWREQDCVCWTSDSGPVSRRL